MAHLDFDALRDMHDSANDVLLQYSPELLINQQLHGQRKWLHRVSEASLRMLDVCHFSKDLLSVVNDHVLELRLALRRSTCTQEAEADYNRFRKKLEKETLKWMKRIITAVGILEVNDYDQVLVVPVVDMLREVRATIISIVQSLLSLVTVPWLERSSSLISSRSSCTGARKRLNKLIMLRLSSTHNYTNCHGFNYYLEDEDEALYTAQKRLEAVEITIQYLDGQITSICRRLIHTRFLLLNILTN